MAKAQRTKSSIDPQDVERFRAQYLRTKRTVEAARQERRWLVQSLHDKLGISFRELARMFEVNERVIRCDYHEGRVRKSPSGGPVGGVSSATEAKEARLQPVVETDQFGALPGDGYGTIPLFATDGL